LWLESSLFEYSFADGESKVHLKSDRKMALHVAMREIRRSRRELIEYIQKHPEFQYALESVRTPRGAPYIVRVMIDASTAARVGPMASVAGALADLGMIAMLRSGAKTAVVEDGGEIAAFTNQPIIVSLWSGSVELSGRIAFQIVSEDCPIGIATSSSKTGHALSFGEADSVTVVASSASLADAAATAICNSVVGRDVEESIQQGLKRAETIEGARGAVIIREGRTGLWGMLPKIVKVK